MRRGLTAAFVLAAYAAAFAVALPLGLWALAAGIDAARGWRVGPSPWGWPFLVGGLGLMAAAVVQLAIEAHAAPVSALPPRRLARGGPYALVRHPIYLGFDVALFGIGLVVGSAALAWLVAPAFAPLWIGYAALEDRRLSRRFGREHRRYRRRVGLLPPLPVWTASRVAVQAWPIGVDGSELVPQRGAALLVANHCCYLDPFFLSRLTRRRVHFLATAEAFRRPLVAWYASRLGSVPLRRYRPDPAAWREVLALLRAGELVGVFPEGERSTLGRYEGARPAAAAALPRLDVPVIPVAIDGSYDCGPRWADVLRARAVRLRAGPPLRWGADPAAAIDAALRALLAHDPQPFGWGGLDARRLGRVLWRCPRCLDERAWEAARLACARCGARWVRLAGGRLAGDDGAVASLATLATRVREAEEPSSLQAFAQGAIEADTRGRVRPLLPLGAGFLFVSPEWLTFGPLRLATAELRSSSVERADTLQVATAGAMWQFRLLEGSAFRFERALARWTGERRRAA